MQWNVFLKKELAADTVLAGYIVGGIKSDLPLGFINNPTLVTRAHDTVYKVYLIKGEFETGIEKIKSNNFCQTNYH